MSSIWGERIKISIFGGSHTEAIGVTIDGLPAGEAVSMDEVLLQMARRAPGQDLTATARKESDTPRVLCGLLDGVTTGAPLTAIIENTSQHSKDYSDLKAHPRPGHADYPAFVKFGGHNDIRGGGHFSGRLTAPLVFAGAVARQILARKGVLVASHITSIESVGDGEIDPVAPDLELLKRLSREYFPVADEKAKQEMRQVIETARADQDSVGGTVECFVIGVSAGVGELLFGGVEPVLSSLLFAIPAVKGVDFGAGFSSAYLRGSENNDAFYYDETGVVKTRTNRCGGVLGGITTGMPLVFQVAFKPTPSIGKEQETVDLLTGEPYRLSVQGRHDPCIVPRAAPVVEAAAAVAVLELLARSGLL